MKIACVGRVVADVVVPDTKTKFSHFGADEVDQIEVTPGGGAFAASRLLAGLGHEVVVISRVGDDALGRFLIDSLTTAGVGTQYVSVDDELHTSKSVVKVNANGLASYLLERGADNHLEQSALEQVLEHNPDAILFSSLPQYLERHDWFPRQLRELRRKLESTIFAADMDKLTRLAKGVWDVADCLDYLFGNHDEMRSATDQNILSDIWNYANQEKIRNALVVKLGQWGAFVGSRNNLQHIPGYRIAKVLNNNGSGDYFFAAAVDRLVHGDSLEAAIEHANAVGAAHVREGIASVGRLKKERFDETIADIKKLERSPAVPTNQPLYTMFHQNTPEDSEANRLLSDENVDWWVGAFIDKGQISPESLVLDAGCGNGRFAIKIARKTNCRMIGIDRRPEAIDRAKSQEPDIEWIPAELEYLETNVDVKKHQGSVDAVLLSSVLAHLDPNSVSAVLANINKLLTDDGLLLIRTLPRESLRDTLWYQFFPDTRPFANLHYWSLTTILSFLVQSGFEIVQLDRRIDIETSTIDDLEARYRNGCYAWTRIYADRSESLEAGFKAMRDQLGAGSIEFRHPSYILVAQKRAEAS